MKYLNLNLYYFFRCIGRKKTQRDIIILCYANICIGYFYKYFVSFIRCNHVGSCSNLCA